MDEVHRDSLKELHSTIAGPRRLESDTWQHENSHRRCWRVGVVCTLGRYLLRLHSAPERVMWMFVARPVRYVCGDRLTTLQLLNEYSEHEVNMYEKNDYPGGHTHTVEFKRAYWTCGPLPI